MKALFLCFLLSLSQLLLSQKDSIYYSFSTASINPTAVKAISINCMHGNEYGTDACDSIPSGIEKYVNLETLSISESDFKHLPDSIGRLRQLRTLILNYDRNFNIESEFNKLRGLDSLQALSLWMDNLQQLPSSLLFCPNLTALNISFNEALNMKQSIGLLANFPKLEWLDLSGLKYKVLPTNILNIKSLRHISLSYSEGINWKSSVKLLSQLNLEGLKIQRCYLKEIPPSIAQCHSLKHLNLHDNLFDSIPSALFNLDSLEELVLSEQTFEKRIFIQSDIVKLKNLKTLHVALNFKSDWYTNLVNISRVSSLEKLILFGCYIEKLPVEFSSLQKLSYLNYSRNPTNDFKNVFIILSKIHTLKYLDLGDNKIDTLPEEIGLLQSLEYLNLEYNNLTSFPESIYMLKNLRTLNVCATKLTDAQLDKLKSKLPQCKVTREPVFMDYDSF